MPKKQKKETFRPELKTNETKLLDEVQRQEADSEQYFSTLRDDWPDKESMLIVQNEDELSKKTKNKVHDPRLATIVFERTSRVMAQNPKGKAFANSSDDVGKNLVMNHLLDWYTKNANEQYPMLTKWKLMDQLSMVYGAFFGLVPWRVNQKNGYMGPELLLIPMRDVRPQPGVPNVDEMDYFQVRNYLPIQWLMDQAKTSPDHWKGDNIAMIAKDLENQEKGGDADKADDNKKRSYVEQTWFPTTLADRMFPRLETFTSYMGDKWVTWVPKLPNSKTSQPYIIRVVEGPYPDEMLPIVDKQCFPLLESVIGLGEFERGKTLQFAINSLINLYLEGVKYSIFPPLQINPKNVVPSTIKWGAGERWLMKQPGVDVQSLQTSPQGLSTFNSTYGFLLSSLLDQAGTTNAVNSQQVDSAIGKTPQAIRAQAAAQNARDKWDQMMMEDTIQKVMDRWVAMIADPDNSKLVKAQTIRIVGDDLDEIASRYPDAMELFESGERGNLQVKADMVQAKYDYEVETGSTLEPNLEGERQAIADIVQALGQNPNLVGMMQQEVDAAGQPAPHTVRFSELFKRHMKNEGIQDADKIVVPLAQQPQQPGMAVEGEQGMPAEQVELPEFQDPDVAAAAAQIFGGAEGTPVQQ